MIAWCCHGPSTGTDPDRRRLARLLSKARDGQWQAEPDFGRDLGPRLPLWRPRKAFADAVNQLLCGEQATLQFCRGLPYGDSGVFIRRLEGAGLTCCISDPPLVTSSRCFENRHPLAIVLGSLWIHLLYYLGVGPRRLARAYKSARHAPKAEAQTL